MKPHLLLAAVLLALVTIAPRASAVVFVYQASLSGANEVPPNASPGTGWVTVTYDSVLQSLRIEASFSGLTGVTTAAHIHASASPGVNVGVATPIPSLDGFPLGVTSGSVDTTLNLTLTSSFNGSYITNNGGTPASAEIALAQALADGKAYFNVHTSTFGGGEVRGNLASVPDTGASLAMLLPVLIGLVGLARGQQRRRNS